MTFHQYQADQPAALLHKKTKQENPDESIVNYEYDRNSDIIRETDKEGYVKEYAYDGAGRLLIEEDALGRCASYVYDAYGNLTKEILKNE